MGEPSPEEALDQHFLKAAGALDAAAPRAHPVDPAAPVRPDSRLTGDLALELFDAQLGNRHLDLAARYLRAAGQSFYTIGSSGHEGNAAVAAAVRPTDPALLHYRSGGFYCARADQVGDTDPIRDVLRGLVAAATEPIAGGRHKVFGHPKLAVVPTTSTIASHLPRAVGLAYAIEQLRTNRVAASTTSAGPRRPGVMAAATWPSDAIVLCSFGDASVNHAVAQAAFN